MAVSKGKMLGHFRRGCVSYKCRQCGGGQDTTRWRKRVEAREVEEEITEEAAMWREQPELMREIAGHVSGAEPLKLLPVNPSDL